MLGTYDVAIIGGGIIGLSVGLNITERSPRLKVAVFEKEEGFGRHQTGHNSGVMHSGVYYRPGSLKAKLCKEGVSRLREFCDANAVPYREVGKVIVATDEREMPALLELERRGLANGVPDLHRISPEELRDIEPYASGVAALHLPHTGIVDYGSVVDVMVSTLRSRGVDLYNSARVEKGREEASRVRVCTTRGDAQATLVVNCAGLYADKMAQSWGAALDMRIVPFRGEYYFLRPQSQHLVHGLIYPVPDPRMPFLGVHFTRTMKDDVEAGPNAVLAFAREGYRKSQVNFGELWDALTYSGTISLARRHWRTALFEYHRSLRRAVFVRSLQRLVPSIQESDVTPGGSGVRAQALDRTGFLLDDFHIVESAHAVHVLNAPSPAATSSLAIGDHVATAVIKRLS